MQTRNTLNEVLAMVTSDLTFDRFEGHLVRTDAVT